MNSNKFTRQILQWFFAIFIAILCCSLVVLVYDYSGTHIKNKTGSTDYKWMSNQYKANATEGINYMTMDANGFNNLSSDISNIDILLMGGSHMEAIQLPTKYNTASLLNKELPDMYTYNIGMSGHHFLYCLDNLDAAIDEFAPNKYVIIQTSNLLMTLNELYSIQNDTFSDIPSYDDGVIYYLQMIPLFKTFYSQAKEKVNTDTNSIKKLFSVKSETYDTSLDNFIEIENVLLEVLIEKEKSFQKENHFSFSFVL